ncbi:hypothetical protein P9112_009970 [Eukaryota sp. TZLM1-RC]
MSDTNQPRPSIRIGSLEAQHRILEEETGPSSSQLTADQAPVLTSILATILPLMFITVLPVIPKDPEAIPPTEMSNKIEEPLGGSNDTSETVRTDPPTSHLSSSSSRTPQLGPEQPLTTGSEGSNAFPPPVSTPPSGDSVTQPNVSSSSSQTPQLGTESQNNSSNRNIHLPTCFKCRCAFKNRPVRLIPFHYKGIIPNRPEDSVQYQQYTIDTQTICRADISTPQSYSVPQLATPKVRRACKFPGSRKQSMSIINEEVPVSPDNCATPNPTPKTPTVQEDILPT